MKRLVIKIGSNILTAEKGGLDLMRMQALADDIAAVRDSGYEAAVVSSGAIAAGMKKLELREKPRDIILKQAAAAVGQSTLMWAYEKCFNMHKKKVAQVLLTRDDFSDRKRYINAKNALMALLSYGIIPIINENDTVATEEIKFGDNDNLASLVARAVEASRLVILSDVDGLYSEDPRKNSQSRLIEKVGEITPELEKKAGGSGTAVGTGGMYSKILAAKKAAESGITVNIINGRKKGLILSLLNGQPHGTEFQAQGTKTSSRKSWIAHGSKAKGTIYLDDGAVKALLHGGKSLLPSGIVSLTGRFEAGDAVYCADKANRRIAKGLANYSSDEVGKIRGEKTTEIEKILGYRYSDEVIHRDNLVLL